MDLQKKNAMQSSVLDSRRTGKRMVEQDQTTYRSRGGGKGGGGESSQNASIAQFVKSSHGAEVYTTTTNFLSLFKIIFLFFYLFVRNL